MVNGRRSTDMVLNYSKCSRGVFPANLQVQGGCSAPGTSAPSGILGNYHADIFGQ